MSAKVMSAEPEIGAGGFLGRGRERLDGAPLFGGQLGGHGHVDGDEQVATFACRCRCPDP